MADTKITALTAIGANPIIPSTFPIPMVDLTDTSMAASGTTKKVTVNQILQAGGTATLASATITGDLTVDTSTLKVDSANNYVGIGTASPVQSLTISGEASVRVNDLIYWNGYYNAGFKARAAGYAAYIGEATSGDFVIANTAASAAGAGSSLSFLDRYRISNSGVHTWEYVGGVAGTAMTLNSTGLGVGGSPSYKLHVNGTDTTNVLFNGATKGVRFVASASNYSITGVDNTGAATFQPLAIGGASLEFQIGSTTQMTLDASGILVVGNTAAASVGVTGGWLAAPNSGNSYELIGHNSGSASGSVYSYFFYNSSQIGSITQNGTTGVLYNTTSDYRLKESVQPIANGLARVNALKPSIYKWKVDGSNGEGFIAHELAEVVPFAVSGEKDAVNEDGSIKPQGVDLSKVVPILVAAIQELAAEVNALKNA